MRSKMDSNVLSLYCYICGHNGKYRIKNGVRQFWYDKTHHWGNTPGRCIVDIAKIVNEENE